MKIVEAWPPNIEKIRKVFGEIPKTAAFAWGEFIFNPSGNHLPEQIRIHELTHISYQGKDVEGWWDKYLTDKTFRYNQELEAYSNEYNCYRTMVKDREKVNKYLVSIAKRFSAPMYGDLITFGDALKLVKIHADQGYTK